MFGIGGGELIFIMFVVLMLFGSDKVPEMARTMGKAMAQLKNATNDIKNEIHKGADANGLNQNMLSDLTNSITSEINSVKTNLLGDSDPLRGISDNFLSEIDKSKSNSTTENLTSTIEPSISTTTEFENTTDVISPETTPKTDEIDEPVGPIKRKK